MEETYSSECKIELITNLNEHSLTTEVTYKEDNTIKKITI